MPKISGILFLLAIAAALLESQDQSNETDLDAAFQEGHEHGFRQAQKVKQSKPTKAK